MFPIIAGLAVVGFGAYCYKKYQESQELDSEQDESYSSDDPPVIKPINVNVFLKGQLEESIQNISLLDAFSPDVSTESRLNAHYEHAFEKINEALSTLEPNFVVKKKELEDRFELVILTDSDETAFKVKLKLFKLGAFFMRYTLEQIPVMMNECREEYKALMNEFHQNR